MYGTPFYVTHCRTEKVIHRQKQSGFFGPPCILLTASLGSSPIGPEGVEPRLAVSNIGTSGR